MGLRSYSRSKENLSSFGFRKNINMKSISKSLFYLTGLFILWTLAGCDTTTPVTVNTAADPTAVFGKYHTYALDTASIGLSATGSAALQSALRTDLAAKGLRESGGSSDLYIVPTVYTQQKLNVMPGGGYTVFPSAYGGYRMGTVALNAGVQTYTEGTLVIDFVDRRTHTVVYRGSGQAAVGSAERNANAIAEAVNKIVASYP
jgi:Domain of unknown function (DUF4136)